MLLDVMILEKGPVEQDGLVSFLVAIPADENQNVLPLLDRDTGNIVAYLLKQAPAEVSPLPSPSA